MLKLVHTRTKEQNTLARKFSELKDFPKKHKLSYYGYGSILGDEDVCYEREFYSCSVRCVTDHGSVYALNADIFRTIKIDVDAW